eukprot:3727948-Rhodomonas_salina.3
MRVEQGGSRLEQTARGKARAARGRTTPVAAPLAFKTIAELRASSETNWSVTGYWPQMQIWLVTEAQPKRY